jgi:hypothetical protein
MADCRRFGIWIEKDRDGTNTWASADPVVIGKDGNIKAVPERLGRWSRPRVLAALD